MSVIVFAQSSEGTIKKSGFEAVTYAKKTAELLGTDCKVIVLGTADNAAECGIYGADSVYQDPNTAFDQFDSQLYTDALSDAFSQLNGQILVLAHSANGKGLAGRLSVRLHAGLVSGVNSLPETNNGFLVKKSVYSGKAIASFKFKTDQKILSLVGNSIKPEKIGEAIAPQNITLKVSTARVKVIEQKTIKGEIPLPEATTVVSAGRGMKDPSNWGIVEDLAKELGATLACSRPVADAHWRPHHEHVGQTGVAIRPNLYIAIGISGAIQHLAGVNNSKVIVVINKDPEAPFFKAADYGVVGDLFEVVPKLTEAVKKLHQQ